MNLQRRALLAAAAPALLLGAWVALTAGMVWATLAPAERDLLSEVLASRLALVLMAWIIVSGLLALLAQRLFRDHVAAVAQLDEATRVHLAQRSDAALPDGGGSSVRSLAQAIAALVAQRTALQDDMQQQVLSASRQVDQERRRLAALMAELTQSVVVCNLDGRILLYNGRAKALFQRLSRAPDATGGAELIGLGRSIHAVIDRPLVAHARETIERRLARGEASAAAQFVTTTPAGHLLRIGLAPVRPPGDAALSGFVLLIDDITDDYAAESRRDRRLVGLTEASRASLASMQAALDMLDYPDLEPTERENFQAVVRDEVEALSARLADLAADASEDRLTRWPLQEMLGADLVTAAAQRIEAETGRPVVGTEVDGALWLRVDSFALIQAVAFLARRLDRADLSLRLEPAEGWAYLDLAWPAGAAPPGAAAWQGASIELADGPAPLSPRDVAERHGGTIWLGHDRPGGRSFFRFLLPPAAEARHEVRAAERPEYYDFDLFAAGDAAGTLGDRRLDALACTVFDTETTGLDPAGGDEIIQLGAVRILNGRLLGAERFDQLVDPGRSIPEASIPFHGIGPDMVRGQPRITEVLPAFHAFAADTVLVGHNVAFDMRFLQLKEAATGVRFDQPVLDTLLLASVAQPDEASHALEAIAARLGVEVAARHSAAGDALTTARVFLKLLPLLAERDITTLGQALEAAKTSYYARLRY